MTEKEMRLKRIDNINDMLRKKYKSIEINKTIVFLSENGQVFRVDSIGKFNAIVVEYADNIELAKKGIFGEDGDLLYMDELDEKEMYRAIIQEIEE